MMTTKMVTALLVVLAWFCLANQSQAQVVTLRQHRLQRQRQQVQEMPYPAAGYRPGRQFVLPQEQPQQAVPSPSSPNDESDFANAAAAEAAAASQPRRPDLIYGVPTQASPQAPARLIQGQQQQQFFLAPQRATTRSRSERLTALQKSARLAVDSENLPDDDEDDIASDIEVDVKTESEQPRAAVANPQPMTVYYPAGAVNFLQPFPGAAYVQTAPAPPITNVPQPATAAYLQALQYSNYQVPAAVPAPMTAVAPSAALIAQPAQPLQAHQVASAKLTAQPLATTAFSVAPATIAATSPFYASTPAAYTTSQGFISSPAAYTTAFAQPQYYVAAPASASVPVAATVTAPATAAQAAQLQAW